MLRMKESLMKRKEKVGINEREKEKKRSKEWMNERKGRGEKYRKNQYTIRQTDRKKVKKVSKEERNTEKGTKRHSKLKKERKKEKKLFPFLSLDWHFYAWK